MCFPANLNRVSARVQYRSALHRLWGYAFMYAGVRRHRGSVQLVLSQPCLPVCVIVRCVRNRKLLLPEGLQLSAAVGQGPVDGISFLLLQLAVEQNEAWDADKERDSPQAQCQTQVGYPEKKGNII